MKIKQNPFANCTTLQHLDTDGWELKPSKMYNYAKGDVDMGNSMDKELNLLYFKMCLLQAEIAMNSMIAANKEREIQGYSLAYNEEAFLGLIEKFGIHNNAFVSSLIND